MWKNLVYVDIVGSDCSISNEHKLNSELMIEALTTTVVYSCNDPIWGYPYDDIKAITFSLDGVVTSENEFIFEFIGDYGLSNDVYGCFPDLIPTGLHNITVKAYGGYMVFDPNTGKYKVEYSLGEPYSSITKSFNVVDCNESVTITSQSGLNSYNGNILAGNISINPTSGSQIILNSNDILNIKAYNELILYPGVLLDESSDFVGMHKLCPELDCDCYENKNSEVDAKPTGNLVLYPNPTTNILNVTISYPDDLLKTIEVYNTIGEMIYKKDNIKSKSFNFNVSNHPSGLFVAKIKTYNHTFLRKFIKH